MFSDYDNAIDRKFLSPERDGFTNCLKDRNVFRFANFLTQSAFLKLMDVNRHNVDP